MFTLLVDLVATAQAAALTASVDLGRVVLGGAFGAFTLLLGLCAWFLRRLVVELTGGLAGVRREVGELRAEMQGVSHTLTGPDGRNGVRGHVKRMKRLVIWHDRVLVRLATAFGIDISDLQHPSPEDPDS
jgi:hypothetical protein